MEKTIQTTIKDHQYRVIGEVTTRRYNTSVNIKGVKRNNEDFKWSDIPLSIQNKIKKRFIN